MINKENNYVEFGDFMIDMRNAIKKLHDSKFTFYLDYDENRKIIEGIELLIAKWYDKNNLDRKSKIQNKVPTNLALASITKTNFDEISKKLSNKPDWLEACREFLLEKNNNKCGHPNCERSLSISLTRRTNGETRRNVILKWNIEGWDDPPPPTLTTISRFKDYFGEDKFLKLKGDTNWDKMFSLAKENMTVVCDKHSNKWKNI